MIVGFPAVISAFFTGYVALRQMPKQTAKIAEVHTLVNDKSDKQEARINALETTINELRRAALEKSDAALMKAETKLSKE